MKNVQVIDGAENCTYDIFSVSEADFSVLFPGGTDVEFSEDVFERIGKEQWEELTTRLWTRRVDKKAAVGIHGTLFFGLSFKKRYYPSKLEAEMVALPE